MRGWHVRVSSYTEVVPLQKTLGNTLMSKSQMKMPKDLLETNGTNAFTLFKKNETGKIKQTMRNQHFVNNLFVIHQHNFIPQLSPLMNVCAFFVLFFP